MKKYVAFLLLFLGLILMSHYSHASDDAEIIGFSCPMGLQSRDDTLVVDVGIKNTGTSTRSFWVGLSFANETASATTWPIGWYDIPPIESRELSPNEQDALTFEFTIPYTIRPGYYYAVTAVWNGFDADGYEMVEPRFDDSRLHSIWDSDGLGLA